MKEKSPIAPAGAPCDSSPARVVERVQMKKPRNVLHWSPDVVRYHDVAGGRWIDHQPVSEAGAMIWCAVNGVEFRKSPAHSVAVADVIFSQLEVKGDG